MLVNSSDQLRTLSVINVAGLSFSHKEFPHFNFFAKNLSHNWRKRDKKCRKRGNVCHGIKADDLKLKGRGQHHKTLQVCTLDQFTSAIFNFKGMEACDHRKKLSNTKSQVEFFTVLTKKLTMDDEHLIIDQDWF